MVKMNKQLDKVLDNGQRVVIDLKRKCSDHGPICAAGTTKVVFPLDLSSVFPHSKLSKRRRLDESGGCDFLSGRLLLKYYANFKKTGNLQRLLYYQNDEWNDFSESVVEYVNKDTVKNPVVEVQANGSKILLDFLRMVQLDLDTGLRHPIAWIDVSGNCFFPGMTDSDNHVFEPEHAEDYGMMGIELQGYGDVNLNLEIEMHRSDNDATGYSVGMGELVKDYYCESHDDGAKGSPVENGKDSVNWKSEENLNHEVTSVNRSVDFSAVREMFFKATKPDRAKIVAIRECKSLILESHFELFEKQLEITKKYRGHGNVRYAWFPCPIGSVPSILNFGVGSYKLHQENPYKGVGLYLIPANGTQFSINDIDVDENGSRHVVLCRVIMGNMEVVHFGSEQSHPSSDNFDSGVDDPQSPSCYILWSVNMNSRIHPECVVSFNVSSDNEGCAFSMEPGVGVPGDKRLPAHVSAPRSPWMAFPVLFASISSRIPPYKMERVTLYYDLFKNKMITRDSFIMKLRVIVGDALLKSAITGLRRESQSPEPSTSVVETS